MLFLHSYTYRGQSLARAARKAAEFGYDGIELVTGHFDYARPAEALAEAARLIRQNGSELAVVDYRGGLIAQDPAARAENEAQIAAVIRAAAAQGARGVNGSVGPLVGPDAAAWSENGSRIATEAQYLQAAEALQRLSRVAEDAGSWISLEIHMNTPHDTAASTRKLLDLVDRANVFGNLDPGNMYAVADAEEPATAVEILGPRLGYVHLKNCREIAGAFDYSWPLESGDMDLFRAVQAVEATGYQGDYCIEYCGKGDPSTPAQKDALYFREILRELSL